MDKKALRSAIRDKKRAMTPRQIEEKSADLTRQFLATALYKNAKTLYGYLPYNQEVRTVPLLQQALADGKSVAVPKVYDDAMRFILLTDLAAVEKGYAGIPEPIADGPVATDDTALVLMHPTVALCYDFQMLPQLETEDHDILVDLVLWA